MPVSINQVSIQSANGTLESGESLTAWAELANTGAAPAIQFWAKFGKLQLPEGAAGQLAGCSSSCLRTSSMSSSRT